MVLVWMFGFGWIFVWVGWLLVGVLFGFWCGFGFRLFCV